MPATTTSDQSTASTPVSEPTVSGAVAAQILGITYRRIDHHLRTVGTLDGIQTPGSGHPRRLTQADLFSIAITATIREALGSEVDFRALMPRMYEAFEGDAQIAVTMKDDRVGVSIDGSGVRDHIATVWAEYAVAEEPEPEVAEQA